MILEGDTLKTRVAVRCRELKVQGFLKGMEFVDQLCCCKIIKKDCTLVFRQI